MSEGREAGQVEPLHRRMPEAERRKRGLLNGYRVTMAREARGHNRAWLARRLARSRRARSSRRARPRRRPGASG